MSTNTSTGVLPSSSPSPSDTAASSPSANPSNTAAAPPDTSSTAPPTSLPTSDSQTTSSPPPPPTTSDPFTTSSSTTPIPTTSSTSTPPPVETTRVTTIDGRTSTFVTVITSTQEITPTQTDGTSSTTTSAAGTPINPGGSSEGGLNTSGKIAVGVVVPIAAVALLVLAGIFFWRKRKARKDLEEERRKEMDDYAYNPNADPTIPAVGMAGDGPYEMKEDGASGYRGWGSTTAAGSTGRKASTTMSGGVAGVAYSDATSPTRGNISDTRSGEPLVEGSHGSHSPEGEILGAMGPSAAANRGADVRRGPSNASSSYSAAARSDGSGDGGIGMAYGGSNQYDQYGTSNPYADQQRTELPGQPVIRDNPARRNTRIENPSHYPQQSAGISQNF